MSSPWKQSLWIDNVYSETEEPKAFGPILALGLLKEPDIYSP